MSDVGGYVFVHESKAGAGAGRAARVTRALADADGTCWIDDATEPLGLDAALSALADRDAARVRCHCAGLRVELVIMPVEERYATFGFFVSQTTFFSTERETAVARLFERWADWCDALAAEFAYVGRFAAQTTIDHRDELRALLAAGDVDALMSRAFHYAFLCAAFAGDWRGVERAAYDIVERPSGALVASART